jgi:hypothetical protein
MKEERTRRYGSLAELTEKYIREGDSEDDAFREAKNVLGIK